MNVRPEEPADSRPIRDLLLAAFPGPAEADLVDKLRDRGALSHSLVAEDDGAIIGQIAFSSMTLKGALEQYQIMGLGPMAVTPLLQKKGIGSILVERGIEVCRENNCNLIVVLGHPGFYPRFGFRPAGPFGLYSDFDVPDDVFMVLNMNPEASPPTGKLRYRPEFYEI